MSIRDRTNAAPLYEFTLEPGFDDAIRGQKSTTIDDTLESTVAWNVDESNVRAASGENGANEIDFAVARSARNRADSSAPTGLINISNTGGGRN